MTKGPSTSKQIAVCTVYRRPDLNGTFVVNYFPELIFIDDFLRDVFNADVNVLWSFERCHKVKKLKFP